MRSKKYSIVRSIDKSGRISIPQELLQELRINYKDKVRVNCIDGKVVIEKLQPLHRYETICKKHLTAYSQRNAVACIISDTEHVLISRGISVSDKPLLSKEVQEHIYSGIPYTYNADNPLDLFGSGKFPIDSIYPVSSKDAPYGAVILLHYRPLKESEISRAEMLADMLTQTLSNE